jgi:outer membrane protein
MNKKIAALAVVGATLCAVPAFAQTAAPAAPAAAALRHGTPVPGLCVFSGEVAVTGSQVGKFVGERLRQLEAPIEADLNSQAQAFEQSVQTFNAQQATLTPEQREQQATALNQRRAQLQQLAQVRAREGQLTQQKALERINSEMTPLVSQAYQVHNCSALFDANVVMAIAPQSDITQDVIRALDAKITQFQFERERIDVAGAGAAPAAAAPAAAAPAARR